MDHLQIDTFLVMGFCIGGHFIWNLLQRALGRIVAAVLAQPSGLRPQAPGLFYQNNINGCGPALCARRSDNHQADGRRVLGKMYRSNADFVFTVTRAFVRTCQTPVLILPNAGTPLRRGHGIGIPRPESTREPLPLERPQGSDSPGRSPHPQLLAGASLHVRCRLGPAYRRVRCCASAAAR